MDLTITDFSFFDSYMSITFNNGDSEKEKGLYLKSLHGVSKSRMESLKLIPTYRGEPENDFTIHAEPTFLILKSEHVSIIVTFIDSDHLLIHGTGVENGLRIDTMPFYNFEYSYLLGKPDAPYCMVNSYKNLSRYLVYTLSGSLSLDQKINIDTSGSFDTSDNYSMICTQSGNDEMFSVIIQDIPTHNAIPKLFDVNLSSLLRRNEKKFKCFAEAFSETDKTYSSMIVPAAYVLWSSTVGAQGNLNYSSVCSSIHSFPGVWSWDNCFIAAGLNKSHHKLAYEQIAVVFECQDMMGQIPGSVSDSTIRWNFCKPPVHGYLISKMMKDNNFTKEELLHIYDWISRQVKYYMKYKDSDSDGICEYYHGNDSGQDNSTVFKDQVPVESPDLTAYLIKAMDLLSQLADDVACSPTEAQYWRELADQTTSLFLKTFIKDDLPVSREAFTKKSIDSRSLLPYISLILGKRLPENIRNRMITKLKNEFLTDWGLATEAPGSPCYGDDAYWRGAIWAPTTLLFVEALEDCQEHDLAMDISRRFCDMVSLHGFAENFNSKTGESLRDRSFCWTASTFLYLAEKLHNK